MNKKFKLFFSLSALCFSLAVLCFGVYSAMSVSYSITGSVSYEVTDAFVDVTTTVYSSNAIATSDEELLALANEFVNTIPTTIAENKTVTHITNYDEVFDFNSLYDELDENNGYTPETSLDMTFGGEQSTYSYFVVVNIKNLADNVVYTNISSMTDNLTGISIVATDSNLRIFSDQVEGQSIVFAYAISDLTRSQENTPVDFSLEFTCQAPYTYAEISDVSEYGFLGNYKENDERKYNNKLKSITFTNNQADFDMSKVVDKFDVGEVYGEDGSKASDLYTYFIPNGELFDAYCYAPVNVIYAPMDANFFFGTRHYAADEFTGYENIKYAWQQNYLTTYDFKAFDVSKSTSLQSFIDFEGVREIKNMHFDTSSVSNFMLSFVKFGDTPIETLDLSNFSFESVNNPLGVAGMIGVNDTYLEYLSQQYSSIPQIVGLINSIRNAENIDEKISLMQMFMSVLFPEYSSIQTALAAKSLYSTSIQKIICPKDLNGLVIATPGETPYLIEGTNERTHVLVEGATLIARS